MANILLYLLATVEAAAWLFQWLLRSVKGYQEKQKNYPLLHLIVKIIYLASRGVQHLLKLDFTTINGRFLYTSLEMRAAGAPQK